MTGNRKKNIFIVFFLIAAMTAAAFASAFAVTQEEKDKALQDAKDAKEATEQKRKEAKDAAKKAAAATANLEEAEEKLEDLQGEITATEAQISNTMAEIENTRAEMDAKEAEIADQNEALNNRLTAMYKTGNSGFVDVILSSESVEDLLKGKPELLLLNPQSRFPLLQLPLRNLRKSMPVQLQIQG